MLASVARGVLPGGVRHVSTANLDVRYRPFATIGTTASGLGVVTEKRWGATLMSTGGLMPGFASHLVWLPGHGVGAVLLSNATVGTRLPGGFDRKLLELLFDGRPRAEGMLAADVDGYRQAVMAELSQWSQQPDPAVVAALAPRYHSAALGGLEVRRLGGKTLFDFGGWKAPIASRRNPDGSTSLALSEPGISSFEFAVAERDGKRALVIADHQHEYVFVEVAGDGGD